MFSPVYVERVLDPAYRNWKSFYAADAVRVHRAHLVGLVERGIVQRDIAVALARAIDAMDKDFAPPESIPADTEDLYMLYERELGRRVGPEKAAYLHTARSRNDMDTTVFRMALRRALLDFADAALETIGSVVGSAKLRNEELTILFTHGQPANVSTMAHYLTAFASELLEDAGELIDAIACVNRSTMGACAITGTGFPLDRALVARLLGFADFVGNTYAAISTAHWLTRPAAALESLLQDYTRLVADLIHKASSEVGIVTFPDELVQISSIMPQKRNPVILEHARIQSGMALGGCASLRELYRNVPYQDVNEAADAPVSALFETLATAASATALVKEMVSTLRSVPARVESISLAFGVTSTELADTMVRECGIGFRSAHEITSRFVRSGGAPDSLRAAFREVTGRELTFTDERVADILSPARFVAVRGVHGGPSPEGMAPLWRSLAETLAASRRRLEDMRALIGRGAEELAQKWSRLLA